MRYYRCKCGACESYGSMSPAACYGCPKCGTTLASHPDDHRTPKPHDFTSSIQQQGEAGPVNVPACRYCHQTRWEIKHGRSEDDEVPTGSAEEEKDA